MFDLSTPGSYTVGTVTDPQDSSVTFSFNSNTSSPMHDDGTGYWTDWISCKTGCGSGTNNAIPAALTFDITGTASDPITPASFIANGTPLFFGTDVGISGYGTGDVAAPAVVPVPPSMPLLGSALVILGLILRRRQPATGAFLREVLGKPRAMHLFSIVN
jgi:hypothetical protein